MVLNVRKILASVNDQPSVTVLETDLPIVVKKVEMLVGCDSLANANFDSFSVTGESSVSSVRSSLSAAFLVMDSRTTVGQVGLGHHNCSVSNVLSKEKQVERDAVAYVKMNKMFHLFFCCGVLILIVCKVWVMTC